MMMEAIKTAFFLLTFHSSTIYAVGTSSSETVEVNAAKDNNRKNVPPTKAPKLGPKVSKARGIVMKIKPGPA